MIELFRRNFDTDETAHASPKTEPGCQDATPEAESSDKLEEAWQRGFAEGALKGQEQAAEEAKMAADEKLSLEKAAIAQQLSDLLGQEKIRREEGEKDLVDLFLAIAERIVPDFLEAYGTPLAIKKIEECVHRNQALPELTIRGCPRVIEELRRDGLNWLEIDPGVVNLKLEADPEFNACAANVIWRGGRQEYDLEAACTEILTALRSASEKYLSKTNEGQIP